MGYERPVVGDLVAGVSVALVLVPQALAYAELAGLPPGVGLFAATLPAIAAAFFVSSPYLQTGPTALTSLLTAGALGSLAGAQPEDYVQLAALLALLVGGFRMAFGLMRLGIAAYFVSRPVLVGFTTGAALLIVGSQLPAVFGVEAADGRVVGRVATVLSRPDEWSLASLGLGALTLVITLFGGRIHKVFPSVLVAVAIAWLVAELMGYDGRSIGEVPSSWPSFDLNLPWGFTWSLLVPALVIALVGFAEPSSIARTYAASDRRSWSADREFISQGVANLVAAVSGGYPVGGSFGRSSLNRAAGARTRWAGAVTGLAVLAILPIVGSLSSIPRAILAAVVIGAASGLFRFGQLAEMYRSSRWQAATAVATIVATVALDPRIDLAILVGLGASLLLHVSREMQFDLETTYSDRHLRMMPAGVLWFASINRVQERMLNEIENAPEVDRVTVDLSGIGRLDVTAAYELADMARNGRDNGIDWRFTGAAPHAERLMRAVVRPAESAPASDADNEVASESD